MTVTRRTALLAAAALGTGACAARTGRSSPSTSTPPAARTPGGAPPTATSAPATLPPAPLWRPPPGDPHPEMKSAAAAGLVAAGTWEGRDGGSPAAVAGRLQAAVVPSGIGALTSTTAVQSTLEVVYPQTTGIDGERAGVIMLARQVLREPNGQNVSREVVLDVRLAAPGGGAWSVVDVVATPPLAPAGLVSAAAQRVLDHPRIALPDPARADIGTGRIDDGLLTVLAGLGDAFAVQVHEVYTGHPVHVFGTDRVSRHHQGRAVDVVALDGVAVSSPQMPRDLLAGAMAAAGALGATEVGGPFDLNGSRRGYFTDVAHLDHLHIAVGAGVPPAVP